MVDTDDTRRMTNDRQHQGYGISLLAGELKIQYIKKPGFKDKNCVSSSILCTFLETQKYVKKI